ncbi:MAG: hypothetical protein ABSC13_02000 [Dehalococcoidia bacterium]
MRRFWSLAFLALLALAAASLAACGGSEKASESATPLSQATATPKDNAASMSLNDVPVYPGATEVTRNQWSGADAAIPVIGTDGSGTVYGTAASTMYDTNDNALVVFAWYKEEMSGWTEVHPTGGDFDDPTLLSAAWTKDGGKTAAWIILANNDDGTASLTLWAASQ